MLKIYNTLGRELQEFKPIEEGKVKFYQCGPTVYSHQHIGNMRSALLGDFVRRSLMYMGYETNYVRNITDVGHLTGDDDSGEDKMAKGSKKEGLKPEEIAKKYTDLYHKDIYDRLNILKPTNETVATNYIEQMASMVQTLIDKGYAYATDKAIYFEVSKFKDYTKLSNQNLEMNKISGGHGDVSDPGKKGPFDFSLWFFRTGVHKNAIQFWEVKFDGIEQNQINGFPGWHIECSAMAKEVLGEKLDIHMGGVEHIPIHHTNEIAQSEAANQNQYVNYWLHHEMMEVNGLKMSKSIGNIFTLDDLIEKDINPISYRYFMLGAHYRSKQNFTWEALNSAQTTLKNLVSSLKRFRDEMKNDDTILQEYKKRFIEALEDDFNTPKGLAVLWELVKSENNPGSIYKTIIDFDNVLGLRLEEQSLEVSSSPVSSEIQELLDARVHARDTKDWKKSDEIRDLLKSRFNIEVTDTSEGQMIN